MYRIITGDVPDSLIAAVNTAIEENSGATPVGGLISPDEPNNSRFMQAVSDAGFNSGGVAFGYDIAQGGTPAELEAAVDALGEDYKPIGAPVALFSFGRRIYAQAMVLTTDPDPEEG